jgi:hypothetical protein
MHLCVTWPGSSFPISGNTIQQGSYYSKMHAKLMAASDALLFKGLPAMEVFDALYPDGRSLMPQLIHFVDDFALIDAVRRGYVHKGSRHEAACNTHADRLHKCFRNSCIAMWYVSTSHLAARFYLDCSVDVHINKTKQWHELCKQVGMYTTAAIQSGNIFSICLSQSAVRPAKRGDALMPETITITAPYYGLR